LRSGAGSRLDFHVRRHLWRHFPNILRSPLLRLPGVAGSGACRAAGGLIDPLVGGCKPPSPWREFADLELDTLSALGPEHAARGKKASPGSAGFAVPRRVRKSVPFPPDCAERE